MFKIIVVIKIPQCNDAVDNFPQKCFWPGIFNFIIRF